MRGIWSVASAVVWIGAVLWAGPALAQSAGPLPLTIDEAIGRGLEAAPRIAAAKAREAAADATVAAESAGRRPVVSTSAGYLRTNHVDAFGLALPNGTFRTIFPDIPDNYQARAEADVPVYTAGRVAALVTAAKEGQSAAAADRRSTEADLRLDIATAYWNLVTARESASVLDQALQRAVAAVSDARARADAGFVPPSDVLSAEAERARESVRLIQARHAAALAEVSLDRLIGVELGQPIVPTSAISQPDPTAAALARTTVSELIARARQDRPELDGLRARAAALDASSEAARAALRPAVAAFGAVEPARPNQLFVPRVDQWKTSWSVGVNVNWSLWDGGRGAALAAANTAQAEALRRQADDVEASIGVEIRQRLLDLDADRSAMSASAEAVTAATEAHRVVTERFRAGVSTSIEVLDAEVTLLETALEQTQLTAAERLDEARLRHAVGGH
jgi:outer membrane protein TolC